MLPTTIGPEITLGLLPNGLLRSANIRLDNLFLGELPGRFDNGYQAQVIAATGFAPTAGKHHWETGQLRDGGGAQEKSGGLVKPIAPIDVIAAAR